MNCYIDNILYNNYALKRRKNMETKYYLNQTTNYQIFVRNHSKEGTFKEVTKDLPRIKELGVDMIQLLPIHPIGKKDRKGTYGSPYSVKDYYKFLVLNHCHGVFSIKK